MPLSSAEKIPNLPIRGDELAFYAAKLLSDVCAEQGPNDVIQMVSALQAACRNDWAFGSAYTYPGASITIAVRYHQANERIAWTVEPIFKFTNPTHPEQRPFVRRPANVTEPPILNHPADAVHVVHAFTLSATVENPNLVRVHCGMPIKITTKIPPAYGEMFEKVETHEVRYDPTDYPPLAPPVVTDEAAFFRAMWRIPEVQDTPQKEPGDSGASAGSQSTESAAQPDVAAEIERLRLENERIKAGDAPRQPKERKR